MTEKKRCDENCEHLEECKKRMGLPKNWVFPKWRERVITAQEIPLEERFLRMTGKKLFHKNLDRKDKVNRYVWELINKSLGD